MIYVNATTGMTYGGDRAHWRDLPAISEPPSPHHRPVIEGGEHVGWELDEAAYRAGLDAMVVSRRQAKQALLLAGHLANVQPAIDAIVDDTERAMVQIYWDDATEFERPHPELIGLGYALGLTDAQIDQLFIDAATL